MSDKLAPVIERIDQDLEAALARLRELIAIESISTDPAYRKKVRAAAEWLAGDLESIGFDAAVRDTAGHPMVVAHHPGPDPSAPHVLFYGHYDVQPPDPLDLWESPPFELTITDGPHGKRLVGRGACDDKGQLMTMVEAFRAWKAVHGTLPIAVTMLIEGEEESGSPSLDPFLKDNKSELAADVAIICDTGMWDIDTPAITYMLRGLVYLDATLHGPSHDLHSGMYGGAVVNPINALCAILAELHDDQRRVCVPGFYDDVRELPDDEQTQWRDLGFDEARFLRSAGLKSSVGEKGRSVLERIWSRPTCDVNGIWGGYTNDGAKTVIASRASAKISCRLVPEQDHRKIMAGLKKFLEDRTPPDCRWEFKEHGCSPAIRVPTESSFLEAALKGLEHTYGTPAVLIGCGGSIPIAGSFQRILGIDSLLVGFSLEDDRIHSPNEKYELRCFHMGMRSHAAILDELAVLQTAPAASVRAGT